MRIIRGVASLAILLIIVFAAPIMLGAAWNPPDFALGLRLFFTPDDGTLLVFALVLIGWGAWAVFMASLAMELIARVSPRSRRSTSGTLRVPRRVAAALLGAVFALVTLRAATPQPTPTPVTTSTQQHQVAGSELPGAALDEHTDTPAPTSPHTASFQYRVEQGDDLWSLSERFLGQGSRWPEIVALNDGLDPREELIPGQVLHIPEEATRSASFTVAPAAPADPPDQSAAPRTRVTVQQGDTLWDIAERTLGDGSRWREVYNLNTDTIADPNVIDVGWVLQLPTMEAPSSPVTDAHNNEDTPAQPGTSGEPSAETATPHNAPPHSGESADIVAGDSAADPVFLALGATGPLLAAGVWSAVAAAKETQRWGRPRGRRFLPPSDEGIRAQSALGIVSDTGQLSLLDTALLLIGEHCQVFAIDPPSVLSVVSSPDRIVLTFADPPPDPPAEFSADGRTWTLTAESARHVDAPHGSHPYPTLVTLGTDEKTTVLVNLTHSPIVGIAGGPDLVAGVTHAWVLELATAPWAPELLVHATTDLADTVVAERDDVRIGSDVELVGDLERLVEARRRGLAHHGLADQRPMAAFVFGQHLDEPLRQRVLAGAASSVGVVAVLAHDEGPATWRIHPDGRGTLEPIGLSVPRAQSIPAPTRTAIADLRLAADSPDLSPAPWWSSSDDTPSTRPHARETAPRQEATVPGSQGLLHPLLNILGPIELLGTTGTAPSRGQRTCMEYCAWLLEHPGSTSAAMAASLLVAESSRRSSMSRLRTWLGKDADGDPYLPDAYSGRIYLHPAVSSDWQQLQILIAPGVNRTEPEILRTALGLVRGGVLADAAPGQWSWAEELRGDIMATIRDIGLVLAEHALGTGDIDLARWATARALTVTPEDEELMCARIRVERRAGNHREVERLALKTTAHARRLGVDLNTDTVRLIQEVMEGRVRARTIVT